MIRLRPLLLAAAALVGTVPFGPTPLVAQGNGIVIPESLQSTANPKVPFAVGERLEYKMKLGVFDVGSGWLATESIDSIRGFPSYYFSLGLDGSALFGSVQIHDRYYSWMDVRSLASRRYIRVIDQPGYEGYREFEIWPEERRWARTDEFDDKTGTTLSDLPLDEIAFIQYLRTIDLNVGDTLRFDRYFKDDGNPVEVRVLRRERKETPAGTFETVVVQPIIKTSGLFSEGGNAELYFTDDENRWLVHLRSEVPGFRSITLHLERVLRNGRVVAGGG